MFGKKHFFNFFRGFSRSKIPSLEMLSNTATLFTQIKKVRCYRKRRSCSNKARFLM